jgi:hypothetical protein
LYNRDFRHFSGVRFAAHAIAAIAKPRRLVLQYTIESRELTRESSSESTHHRRQDPGSVRIVVIANDADEAIHQFVREREAELVSFTYPGRGRESIATVKKEDTVFLVRVYAA